MDVYSEISNIGGKNRSLLGGNYVGKVRTEQIKRLAEDLMERFPSKFSRQFENNKQSVERLTQGATSKVRNKVAGYITHVLAGTQVPNPKPVIEETE
jgi:small subunit ribosomal protein S17e